MLSYLVGTVCALRRIRDRCGARVRNGYVIGYRAPRHARRHAHGPSWDRYRLSIDGKILVLFPERI